MGKTKVLECIRQGQIGGGESHLLDIIAHIDKEKYNPIVLSFSDGPMIDALNQMKIENYVIPSKRAFDFSVFTRVRKLLIDLNVSIIHVHGTRANSNIVRVAKSLQIPLVYTIHGWSFHPDQNFFKRKLRILGEKYLTSKSDFNISVSESNKLTGQKLIKGFNSEVINNGINQFKFNPQRKFLDIRKEQGLSVDDIIVLFLARFTGHKQPLILIEAFSKAVQKNKKLHLLMVGEGDQKVEGIKLVDKLKIKEKVTFLPFRTDVPDILSASDIYVLPSLWEGLPIGLLEAMAMGKAVIGSNVDGTCEIIDNSINGFLIDKENLVKGVEEKIALLGSSKKLREDLGKNAIKTISTKYDATEMTRKIEKVYTKLIKK
ncbi:MAG: glycosyltransferase family 4 protein [Ignavibacterium sp.]|nr:glycosyltransferase family 4 protein [Ignavibacterium sp.]